MITRPLDLNSKLRPPPRSFDWVFFVNITLIAMFFVFFGSRFVLSPAIVLNGGDFQPVSYPAAEVAYVPGSVVVSVKANGQIFTDTGMVNRSQLRAWLVEKAKTSPDGSLLIRADANVSIQETTRINQIAREAGFKLVSVAAPQRMERGDGARRGGR